MTANFLDFRKLSSRRPRAKKRSADETAQFLAAAREEFQRDWEAEFKIREAAELDLKFVSGDQWSEQDRESRKRANRPCMTFNRLPVFVQQVSNEARANEIAVRVVPVEDGDMDTASAIEEIARGIHYNSNAEVAYSTAVENSAACGIGYYQHTTEYCGYDSFDQDIKIVPVQDPMSVYGVMIPSIYGMPVLHAFRVKWLTKAEFRAKYGKKASTESFWAGSGATECPDWITRDGVQVAEYWKLEYERVKLNKYLLSDGSTVDSVEPPDDPYAVIVDERPTDIPHVTQYIINGAEILDETEWPGETIPIYAVLGKVMIVDGEPQVFSLVRFMLSATVLINFYKTRIAETLAVQPVSPIIGVEGQFAGHEQEWRTANSTLRPYLEYAPVSVDGKLAPPPQRYVTEAPIVALTTSVREEVDDLKSTGGIFDSSLGNEGNERSGIAIARRQAQSGITNFHFIANLVRSMWQSGRDLVALIPRVMSTERMVRAVGEDDAPKVLAINQPGPDGKTIMLNAGKYDVRVTTGPSFTTKRAESFARVTEMAKAYPDLMGAAGDIVMELSDIPKAEVIAKRLKKIIPAAQDDQQPIPPQVRQKLEQSGQLIEALTQQVNELSDERDRKQLELDSKMQIALLQEETKRVVELAKIDAADGVAALKAEVDSIRAEQQLAHQAAMQERQMEMQREVAEKSAKEAAPAAKTE